MVFGIDRAGIVGEDGSSHQGVFDISLLNALPNMVIAQGKDANEIKNLFDLAFNSNYPFAIRYPRGHILDTKYKKEEILLGKWEIIVNNDNEDAIIISYGNDVCQIEKHIKSEKLNYTLVNARFIKPIDEDLLLKLASKNKPIFIYTNEIIKGGIGDSILELFNISNIKVPLHILGIDDIYVKHGEMSKVKESLHLDLENLYNYIKENA